MSRDIDTVLKNIIEMICSRKEVRRIVLFGSRARGDAASASDIDIAIFDPHWTREDINAMHDILEETIPTALKIDVLAYDLLTKDNLKKRILKEGVVIYERQTAHP